MFGVSTPHSISVSPFQAYTQPPPPMPYNSPPPLFSGNSPPTLTSGPNQFGGAPVPHSSGRRVPHVLASNVAPIARSQDISQVTGAGGYYDPTRFTVSSANNQQSLANTGTTRRLYPSPPQQPSTSNILAPPTSMLPSGVNLPPPAGFGAARPLPPPPFGSVYTPASQGPYGLQVSHRRKVGTGGGTLSSAHSDSSQASKRSTPSQSTAGGSANRSVTAIHSAAARPLNSIRNLHGGRPVNQSSSSSSHRHPPSLPASDDHRQRQRLKQIAFGKVTEGYANYRMAVPRSSRQMGNVDHPVTPDITAPNSKRHWDSLVAEWRRALHKWDNPVGPPNHRKPNLRTFGEMGAVAIESPEDAIEDARKEIAFWQHEVAAHRKSVDDGGGEAEDDDEGLMWEQAGQPHSSTGSGKLAPTTVEPFDLSPFVTGGSTAASSNTLEQHGRTASEGSMARGPNQSQDSAVVGPAPRPNDGSGAFGGYSTYHAEAYQEPHLGDLSVRQWQSEVYGFGYDPTIYQAPSTSGSANPHLAGNGVGGSSSRYLSSHDGIDSNYASDSCASRETPRSANIVPITTLSAGRGSSVHLGSRGGSGRDLRGAGGARGHSGGMAKRPYGKSASPITYMGSGSLGEGPTATIKMAGDKALHPSTILTLLSEEQKELATSKSPSTAAPSSGGAIVSPQSGANSTLSSPPSPSMQTIPVAPTSRTLTYPFVADPRLRVPHPADDTASSTIAALTESFVDRISGQLDLGRLYWLPPPSHTDLVQAQGPPVVQHTADVFKGVIYERVANAILDAHARSAKAANGFPPTSTTTAATSRTSMASGSQPSDGETEDPYGQPTDGSAYVECTSEDGHHNLTWLSLTDAIQFPVMLYMGEMIYNPMNYITGAEAAQRFDSTNFDIAEGGDAEDAGYDEDAEIGAQDKEDEIVAIAANALVGSHPMVANGISPSPSAATHGINLQFDPELIMLREGSASVTHNQQTLMATMNDDHGPSMGPRNPSGSAALADDMGSPLR